jgi:hypothetical protein
MKNLKYVLIALSTSIAGIGSYAQADRGFVIEGMVSGVKDGQKIALCNPDERVTKASSWKVLDSCIVNGGHFIFHGHINGGVRWVSLGDIQERLFGKGFLLGENDTIKVSGTVVVDRWNSVNIDGGKAGKDLAKLYNACAQALDRFSTGLNKYLYTDFFDRLSDSVGYRKTLMDSIENSRRESGEELLSAIARLDENSAVPFFIDYLKLYKYVNNTKSFRGIYDRLGKDVRESYYGRLMKMDIDSLCVGCHAPDFAATSKNGSQLSLNDVLKKNKMVVIEFWGIQKPADVSFNGVTEENGQLLSPFYRKFHSKGFEVIGVSREINKESWNEALAIGNNPWLEVSNLSYDEPVFAKFDLVYVNNPYNVIVDQTGSIIAWNINNDLEMQWLVDKYLNDAISNLNNR